MGPAAIKVLSLPMARGPCYPSPDQWALDTQLWKGSEVMWRDTYFPYRPLPMGLPHQTHRTLIERSSDQQLLVCCCVLASYPLSSWALIQHVHIVKLLLCCWMPVCDSQLAKSPGMCQGVCVSAQNFFVVFVLTQQLISNPACKHIVKFMCVMPIGAQGHVSPQICPFIFLFFL